MNENIKDVRRNMWGRDEWVREYKYKDVRDEWEYKDKYMNENMGRRVRYIDINMKMWINMSMRVMKESMNESMRRDQEWVKRECKYKYVNIDIDMGMRRDQDICVCKCKHKCEKDEGGRDVRRMKEWVSVWMLVCMSVSMLRMNVWVCVCEWRMCEGWMMWVSMRVNMRRMKEGEYVMEGYKYVNININVNMRRI